MRKLMLLVGLMCLMMGVVSVGNAGETLRGTCVVKPGNGAANQTYVYHGSLLTPTFHGERMNKCTSTKKWPSEGGVGVECQVKVSGNACTVTTQQEPGKTISLACSSCREQ